MSGSMASLEEENEVLLARYCMASFLPPLGGTGGTGSVAMEGGGSAHPCFRPRWLTAVEEASPLAASALRGLDGPEEDCSLPDKVFADEVDDQQQSPLLALPEELLWLVWELSLPTPDDLCRWSLVCRRFDRVACGHVGLWTPFLPPNTDLSTLLALTAHRHDPTASSSLHHRVNPKELYRAGRRLQFGRLQRRIDAWALAVAKATSFDDGEEVAEPESEQGAGDDHDSKALKPDDEEDAVCPRMLFRDTFVYLRREPLEPLQSFKMFLWDMVIKSLTARRSDRLEMQVLSMPTPLPMLSVRFHPLPQRTPVIKYVIIWNYFPFHEPKVTAVDSEVFGLPPLPASVKAKRTRSMYLGSKPSADHLKVSIDAKMRFVQEVLDELFKFVADHVHVVDSEPRRSPSSCILS